MSSFVCSLVPFFSPSFVFSRDKTKETVSADATEYGGDSEVKKVSDRNKSVSSGSEEREEGNVADKSVEDISLLHKASDRLFLVGNRSG